jgi:hypothetical protein
MPVLSRVSVFAYQMVDVTPETQVVNSCAKPFGYGHATNPEIILGDPIDPATGAYSVNESWIHIYGSDPLDLRFFYNSQRLIRAEQGIRHLFRSLSGRDPQSWIGIPIINRGWLLGRPSS